MVFYDSNTILSPSIDILVNDKPIPNYYHNGDSYIEARRGSKFKIKIRNPNSERILVIPSIDGISPIDGKEATNDSTGYVVPAYSYVDINGWMIDNNTQAEFVFFDKENNSEKIYSGHVAGHNNNIGVLGFIVYSEYKVNYTSYADIFFTPLMNHYNNNDDIMWTQSSHTFGGSYSDYQDRNTLRSAYTVNAQDTSYRKMANTPNFDMGTGWGSKIDSKTRTVDFKRDRIMYQFSIYYASSKSLEKMGIRLKPEVKPRLPEAFKQIGCKPPNGWSA